MGTIPAARSRTVPTSSWKPSPLPTAFLAAVGGIALFILLLFAATVGYDLYYGGKIFPGVAVVGVDLSGKTPTEAAALLASSVQFPETGKVVFRDGSKVWMATPAEVGLAFDPQTSAVAAYHHGRAGNPLRRLADQFQAWYAGVELSPLLVYDERVARAYLTNLSLEVDKPTVEASLSVNGTEVVAEPGQVGRRLDIDQTLPAVAAQLGTLTDGIVEVVMQDLPPALLDVSPQAAVARQILSAPLTLTLPEPQEGDPGPWTLEPERLARMLLIETVQTPQGPNVQVRLNASALRTYLEGVAMKVARSPQNARFAFDDETRQLVATAPSTTGRSLNVEATLQSIETRLPNGEHNLPLELAISQPELPDTTTAEQLGIRELIKEETSYFYGSSQARIQNIETAASRFNGVLVAPGAVFSMAEVLGDVSLDNGYAEALIIYGNRTIEGVGGGVCQVSTTLFRTVFFAGFPVVERHSHAYRVGYYEQNRGGGYNTDLAGLDATVFVPVVDFKFTNDSPNWILMETETNVQARSLTWRFYSTSDGRTVEWATSGLQNVTEPPEPTYIENPDLEQGEIKQMDWAVEGADISISRIVKLNGQVYLEDEFHTHYVPWGDIYEYGPGTDLPDGQNNTKKKRNG